MKGLFRIAAAALAITLCLSLRGDAETVGGSGGTQQHQHDSAIHGGTTLRPITLSVSGVSTLSGGAVLLAGTTVQAGSTLTLSGYTLIGGTVAYVAGTALFNSTSTAIATQGTSATSFSGCAISTVTITTHGGTALLISAVVDHLNTNTGDVTNFETILIDGAYPTNGGNGASYSGSDGILEIHQLQWGGYSVEMNADFTILSQKMAAGAHTVCVGAWTNTGTLYYGADSPANHIAKLSVVEVGAQ